MTVDDAVGSGRGCPQCGARARAEDRYCWRCGFPLHEPGRRTASAARPQDPLLFLAFWGGPVLGAVVGFLAAEIVLGELGPDAPQLVPLILLIGIGTIVGGPLLVALIERVRRRT